MTCARRRTCGHARTWSSLTDFPAFTRLEVDDRGSLWVRGYSLPDEGEAKWHVLEHGRWVATVRLDASFSLMAVQDHQVIGVWRDAMDVEHVRMLHVDPS